MTSRRSNDLLPFASSSDWAKVTAMPSQRGAFYMSLMYQWERSQWAPPDQKAAQSLKQRDHLLRMASRHTPLYRERLAAISYDPSVPLTEEMWREVPLLSRRDIQTQGAALTAERIPRKQQGALDVSSSGSTGTPIKVKLPPIKGDLWSAATLFEHVVHRRDFLKKAAAMFKAVERNAGNVVGIDAAAGALERARKMASDLNLEKKLTFVESDFMDFSSKSRFDVIFAVGYFDYIFNPRDHLRKMIQLSDGIIYASFPQLWSPFTVTRKIRLMLNRCPVKFYTKPLINGILRELGVGNIEIKTVFRDYILIIRK